MSYVHCCYVIRTLLCYTYIVVMLYVHFLFFSKYVLDSGVNSTTSYLIEYHGHLLHFLEFLGSNLFFLISYTDSGFSFCCLLPVFPIRVSKPQIFAVTASSHILSNTLFINLLIWHAVRYELLTPSSSESHELKYWEWNLFVSVFKTGPNSVLL